MTDIVDRIRQVATALGWRFTYGEADIKNLIEAAQAQDLVPDEVHLMLLPVVRTPQTNDYGGISAINYELAFSIFTPDDFDILVEDAGKEYYWHKFDYKVKPMLTAYYYLHRNLICPGVVLQPRRITEIYNDGTENLTGIFIEATASIEVDSRLGEVVPVPPLPPIPTLCELLADCEVFKSLEQRVTELEAVSPADLISGDAGNALQVGTDGGLYVPQSGGGGFDCNDLEECQNFTDVRDTANQAASDAGAALAGLQGLAEVATTGSYNDLLDKPTIPTEVSQLSNDAGYQTASQVTAAVAAVKPITLVGIAATANSLTGNVTEGILATVPIPANTSPVNTIYEMEAALIKASASAKPVHRIWIGPNPNNLTGATRIAVLTGATTTLFSKMERTFIVTNTGLTILNSANNSGVDDLQVAVAATTVAVDWTQPQYIHHAANNATGETTTNLFLYVKKATP